MWGGNSYGQLPLPNSRVFVPTLCELPWSVRHLACYNATTAVITCDGRLFVWGRVLKNQRPDMSLYIPGTHLSFPEPIVSAVIGYLGMMILTLSGQVYSLGRNFDGFLGIGDRDGVDVFTRVELPLPCFQLKVKDTSSCAIAIDGTLYTWGFGTSGKISIPEGKTIASVEIGSTHLATITTDGCVYSDNSRQLKAPAHCKLLTYTDDYYIASSDKEVGAWMSLDGFKLDFKFKGAIQVASAVNKEEVWFLSEGKYYHQSMIARYPLEVILS